MDTQRTGLEIAVIGMSGRFPKAGNIETFWENIKSGKDCISTFSDEELLQSGIEKSLLDDPAYVRCGGFIENIEEFDHEFFNYLEREARITDPQIRIAQECCWESLEAAGYNPKNYEGAIGLYLGASTNYHWMQRSPLMNFKNPVQFAEASTLSFKDALSTYTSYKLGLTGPSFTLYAACSTSLLAVHLACRSLLTGECEMALAGGVSVSYPKKRGYLYREGLTASPDGKIKSFDEHANGAIFADGAGVVLLKKLEDAIADGDTIHGVIKGSAANNDGQQKVGYTAPSAEGQAEVIRNALDFAEVEASTIGYIETHGTATSLGDAIEFEALCEVFKPTSKMGFCGIGSVKSNIGHLDTAAGVAGLIKTLLALKHKVIPPSINFHSPNRKLNLAESPFYLNNALVPFEDIEGVRRAGVSAFGFGGTNVHVIVEDYEPERVTYPVLPGYLINLSAKNPVSLESAKKKLASFLKRNFDSDLSQVTYTLDVGRACFEERYSIVVEDTREAISQLSQPLQPQESPREAYQLALHFAPIEDFSFLKGFITLVGFQEHLHEALSAVSEAAAVSYNDLVNLHGLEVPSRKAAYELILLYSLHRFIEDLGIPFEKYDDSLLSRVCQEELSLSSAFQELHHGSRNIFRTDTNDEQSPQGGPRLTLGGEALLRFDPEGASKGKTAYTGLLELLRFHILAGGTVHWDVFYQDNPIQKIPLPTYAFQKKRFWLDSEEVADAGNAVANAGSTAADAGRTVAGTGSAVVKRPNLETWFYEPTWVEKSHTTSAPTRNEGWLVFIGDDETGFDLMTRLKSKHNHRITWVKKGTTFHQKNESEFEINPENLDDLNQLLTSLNTSNFQFQNILHTWGLHPDPNLNEGIYFLVNFAKALADAGITRNIHLNLVALNVFQVKTREPLIVENSPLVAIHKTLPQEFPNITSTLFDIDAASITPWVSELLSFTKDTVVAYRSGQRFIRVFETTNPVSPKGHAHNAQEAANLLSHPIKKGETYLITGGLGGIGYRMAKYFAQHSVNLILLSRSTLPAESEWADCLEKEGNTKLSYQIRRLQDLKQGKAHVEFKSVDIANSHQTTRVFQEILEQYSTIKGVIHAAGIVRTASAETAIVSLKREHFSEQFAPKIAGTLNLARLLQDCPLDFFIAVSSLSPILGGLGFTAYAAANAYMDALITQIAQERPSQRWQTINWADWQYAGPKQEQHFIPKAIEQLELTEAEGIETLKRVLKSNLQNIVISSGDLNQRMDLWIKKHEDPAHPTIPEKPVVQRDVDSMDIGPAIETIWLKFFDKESVDKDCNFFDLGATSLHIVQVHAEIVKYLDHYFSIDLMFEYPTIRSLTQGIEAVLGLRTTEPSLALPQRTSNPGQGRHQEIAIIGMAGEFPQSANIEEFWQNLANGHDCITDFTDDELIAAGIKPEEVCQASYVKSKGIMADAETFDAELFGYSVSDAQTMDPQLRKFHECVGAALEDAGYQASDLENVGVYAGASPNLYWQVLSTLSETAGPASSFLTSLLNDKDSLATQISYNFDFTGPSINVFTGCSTSLVAIHLACEDLRTQKAGVAIAGGISIDQPVTTGYLYQEGMLFSKSGRCHTFDEKADGMLFGDGMGVLILKPLEQALADKDNIHCVIKGSAINNDGRQKIGYTAPSIGGQVRVIHDALSNAGASPESVSYIECHGTATKLGDKIEISSIKRAYNFSKEQGCYIGSAKTNFGHLNAASGVTGMIKTALALKHRQIPPHLHFDQPNQEIDFEGAAVKIPTTLIPWKADICRAGVSSFGIGGTNAHVILEEAPSVESPSDSSNVHLSSSHLSSTHLSSTHLSSTHLSSTHLLVLSARGEEALETMSQNLADVLERESSVALHDVAFTLGVGRTRYKQRRSLVCQTREDALLQLRGESKKRTFTVHADTERQKLVLLFPGNGSQYVGMGWELYQKSRCFRESMDVCFDTLRKLTGEDYESVLYPENQAESEGKLSQMTFSQPLIFAFEYSLAKLLAEYGLAGDVWVGYSFGEYVAACLAGVFSLEDGLYLVSERGKLMDSLPSGGMLSVPLEEAPLNDLLSEFNQTQPQEAHASIAIINSGSCVVAGSQQGIRQLAKFLRRQQLMCMPIDIATAAHSEALDNILSSFQTVVQQVQLNRVDCPFMSSTTGNWVEPEQLVNVQYWVDQLRRPVRFAACIEQLKQQAQTVFLEVGPGRDLSALISRQFPIEEARIRIVNTVKGKNQEIGDYEYLLGAIGQLWANGLNVNWERLTASCAKRISLPTYPYERVSFEQNLNLEELLVRQTQTTPPIVELSKWFYQVEWRSQHVTLDTEEETSSNWLIFDTEVNYSKTFETKIAKAGIQIQTVFQANSYKQMGAVFTVRPEAPEDYVQLWKALDQADALPDVIYHFWSTEDLSGSEIDAAYYGGFYSLLFLMKAVSQTHKHHQIKLKIISTQTQSVLGDEDIRPIKAPVLAAANVISQEYSFVDCSCIDLEAKELVDGRIDALIEESKTNQADKFIAFRGRKRWVKHYTQRALPPTETPAFKKEGVYLITGGIGGIGSIIATHLANNYNAKLILTCRSKLPERSEWAALLDHADTTEKLKGRIQTIQALEAVTPHLIVEAVNVADARAMEDLITRSEKQWGAINGVIHAAGIIGGDTYQLMRDLRVEDCEQHFESKVNGTLVLDQLFANRKIDFFLTTSSISTVLGGLGYFAYAGSNTFLDQLAEWKAQTNQSHWKTVCFSDWKYWTHKDSKIGVSIAEQAMLPEDGITCIERVLTHRVAGPLAHSLTDLQARIDQWVHLKSTEADASSFETTPLKPRPKLSSDFEAPHSTNEIALAQIWQEMFNLSEVGVLDDYFELGGDSLKAITLTSLVHNKLNHQLSVKEIFDYPNIRKLALFLDQTLQHHHVTIPVAPPAKSYPLSSAQKRMFFINMLHPESISYNDTSVSTLMGILDVERFRNAFQLLSHRHEIFRTVITLVENEPQQMILDEVRIPLTILDSTENSEAMISDLIQPFDLNTAPLFRVYLLKKSNEEHVLVFDLHHIITDGVSYDIIVSELLKLYNGETLPELKLQYKDYAVWQNSDAFQQFVEPQKKYWLACYADETPNSRLPYDKEPNSETMTGKSFSFQLGSELTEKIKSLGRSRSITLYNMLLSTYFVLLHRYSGEQNIVIGTPVTGRSNEELQKIVGMFINTLPLKNRISPDQSFLEIITEVQKTSIEAFSNQDYPIDQLIYELGLHGKQKGDLFNAVFAMQMEGNSIEWGALKILPYPYDHKRAQFHILLRAFEADDQIECAFEFAKELFHLKTIQDQAKHFEQILEQVVENPEMRIEDLKFASQFTVTHTVAEQLLGGDF